MTCSHLKVGGTSVIVCGTHGPVYACSVCGEIAGKLCDWKLPYGKTCDAPICDKHALSVGKNRDLCPTHAEAWADHPANRQQSLQL